MSKKRTKRIGNISPYVGVAAVNDKFKATITSNGRVINLGTYMEELEAALAYDRAVRGLLCDFVCELWPSTNFTSEETPRVQWIVDRMKLDEKLAQEEDLSLGREILEGIRNGRP